MTRSPVPRRLTAVAILLAALAGCAHPTPYQPSTVSASGRGFSDARIEDNRFQVSFAGNSVTPAETVERYLLFRAAEVTLASGNDWFRIVERQRILSALPESGSRRIGRKGGHRGHGYHGHRGYYHGPRVRWGFGVGFGSGWFYSSPVIVHVPRRFEAFAEILVFPGEKPADDPDAYDARAVIARLGPSILRPDE